MYSEKLVATLKSNGKILREFKDTVLVPFGSEYSIFIKNLNSVRALVRVQIDGIDIAGEQFIVPANGSIELERFVKEGNLAQGNRFRFIERSAAIETHRGIKAEDGLVRIEFEFEQQVPYQTYGNSLFGKYPPGIRSVQPNVFFGNIAPNTVVSGSYGTTSITSTTFTHDSYSASAQCCSNVNDVGITVPGSISSQQFAVGPVVISDGVKRVMVLKLAGEVGQQLVTTPVTVKTKVKCSTCGRVNKADAKFCQECGTSLQIV